jgi:hypothetical protein
VTSQTSGCGKDYVFISNMLSLNGMTHFGSKPNTKTVWAWPKADNIDSGKRVSYIWTITPKYLVNLKLLQNSL